MSFKPAFKSRLFRYLELYIMKQCPSCNSSQISLIEIKSRVPAVSDVPTLLTSPATMSALGVNLIRSTNIPPVIGAIAGIVISGVFMVLMNDETNQPMYYCHSCKNYFDANLRQSPQVYNGY